MALIVVTFCWGTKYPRSYVEKLRAGFARHLREPHQFLVIGDGPDADMEIQDRGLCSIRGCFARLRLFDPLYQESIEIVAQAELTRLVCVDLDVVVTGPLDPLFSRTENFVILHGANASNPCKFNGSIFMLRAAAHPEIWQDFTRDKASAVAFHEFPDDQGWLWHCLPNAAGWNCGRESGIYAFKKPGWLDGDDLPADARMVVFPGWRDPGMFKHLPWVKEHWVA